MNIGYCKISFLICGFLLQHDFLRLINSIKNYIESISKAEKNQINSSLITVYNDKLLKVSVSVSVSGDFHGNDATNNCCAILID